MLQGKASKAAGVARINNKAKTMGWGPASCIEIADALLAEHESLRHDLITSYNAVVRIN